MKRLTGILLALALMLSTGLTVFAEPGTSQPIIKQIYGGGGKGETPIGNSFVELYNPTDAEINLSGYTLTDGTTTLTLEGTIPAN